MAKVGLDDYLLIHTADDLRALLAATEPVSPDDLAGAEIILANHMLRETPSENGRPRLVKAALSMAQIRTDLQAVTGDWPRRLGPKLFFDDGGTIHYADDVHKLYAIIQGKGAIRWTGGQGQGGRTLVTQHQFHAFLQEYATDYDEVTQYPLCPMPARVYSSWRRKGTYQPTGQYLNALLAEFDPASDLDARLIRALMLTLVWGGPPGARPLFIITGDDESGQETGKSRLIYRLSAAVGGYAEIKDLGTRRFGDDICKQALGPVAMRHRIMLLDNTTGVLRSSDLTSIITSPTISGRASHERQAARANYVTWAITTNDLGLNTDLATRCAVIRLTMPDRDARPNWEAEVAAYVDEHREEILVDCIAALQGKRHEITVRRNRFPAWCDQVLALDEKVNELLPRLAEGADEADLDMEDIANFFVELRSRWGSSGVTEFTPTQIGEVWRDANADGLATGWVVRRLRQAIARGKHISLRPRGKKHGGLWIWDRNWEEPEREADDSPF